MTETNGRKIAQNALRWGDEEVGKRRFVCDGDENLGNEARVTTGATVEKSAFVFLALTALRERRVTPREVSIVNDK